MAGIDSFVVFGSHLDGTDGATTATDFSIAQAAKTITFAVNAQIDTAQSVFGGASLLLDGISDINIADNNDLTPSGDFTIDLRIRFSTSVATSYAIYNHGSAGTSDRVFALWDGANSRWYFGIYNAGSVDFEFFVSDTLSIDTWYHVALVRSGSNWYWFRDGTQLATTSNAISYPNKSAVFYIGSNDLVGTALIGWIDEFRFSNGVARWTANFTPPTAAYSVGGATFTSRLALMGVG